MAIATYQRRDSVVRLLHALADHLRAEPAVAERTEVLVVVDGSTDGTTEAASAVELPVPCRVVWQENGGLAKARNQGWQLAGGDLVLFLDDDFVPVAGFIGQHLAAHADGRERVVVGPCDIPDEIDADDEARRWYGDRYSALAEEGSIRRFNDFAAANGSFPVSLLRRVDGFDERFRGYGLEDYELGYRLLTDGYEVRFEPTAGVRHLQQPPGRGKWELRRQEGRNIVRFLQRHGEALDALLPATPPSAWYGRLRRLGVRRPRTFRAIAWCAAWLVPLQARFDPTGRHTALLLTDAAAVLAGIAEQDRDGRILDRALGCSV